MKRKLVSACSIASALWRGGCSGGSSNACTSGSWRRRAAAAAAVRRQYLSFYYPVSQAAMLQASASARAGAENLILLWSLFIVETTMTTVTKIRTAIEAPQM